MSRITHATQIGLRFSDPAGELLDPGIGLWPGNFARERFDLFGQRWVGASRQAQPVAKRIARRASAAPCSFRTSAGPRIRAVGLDLTVARQGAFFPFAGVVSTTLNSASSISRRVCRNGTPRTA